jgi:hypothetical protein
MSYLNHEPARTLDAHKQALHLLGWDVDDAGEAPDANMIEAFEVWADDENNNGDWWSALDDSDDMEIADITADLRTDDRITVSATLLAKLARLPGFEDDGAPDHAPHPLLWESVWVYADIT